MIPISSLPDFDGVYKEPHPENNRCLDVDQSATVLRVELVSVDTAKHGMKGFAAPVQAAIRV